MCSHFIKKNFYVQLFAYTVHAIYIFVWPFYCVLSGNMWFIQVFVMYKHGYLICFIVPPGYPVISESPTLKAVEKDRNTIMVCTANGNPDPHIMWLKDFIPVDLTDPRLKLLPSGSTVVTLINYTNNNSPFHIISLTRCIRHSLFINKFHIL